MIGPVQQKVDPLHTEMAEIERLIGIQDELTIATQAAKHCFLEGIYEGR
jgi:hypothetical protein